MKAQIESIKAKMNHLNPSDWVETRQLLCSMLSLPVENMIGINQLTGMDRIGINEGFLQSAEDMVNSFLQ